MKGCKFAEAFSEAKIVSGVMKKKVFLKVLRPTAVAFVCLISFGLNTSLALLR
jgi:hypothetical protein